MLRPGLGDKIAASLWLFGLPSDIIQASSGGRPPAAQKQEPAAASIDEALQRVLPAEAESGPSLLAAAQALQQRLQPEDCVARWVDAAYWSSDRAVCDLGGGKPLALLGDAACGRPFYTASTLNRHFSDVAAFVDDIDWGEGLEPLSVGQFAFYERRFQADLRRVPEFHRQAAVTLPLQSGVAAVSASESPQPPPPLGEAPSPTGSSTAAAPPGRMSLEGGTSPRKASPKALSQPLSVASNRCTQQLNPSALQASSSLPLLRATA